MSVKVIFRVPIVALVLVFVDSVVKESNKKRNNSSSPRPHLPPPLLPLFSIENRPLVILSLKLNEQQQSLSHALARHNRRQQISSDVHDRPYLIGNVHSKRQKMWMTLLEAVALERRVSWTMSCWSLPLSSNHSRHPND